MAVPSRRRTRVPGVWLTSGGVDVVARWGARGVVPLHVIPVEGWTATLPAGESRAAAPYDESLPLLAARQVRRRMRPALGFFVIHDKAVVVVQPRRLRAQQRFVVWEPASGVLRSPGLPVASPSDLLRAAGQRDARAGVELRDLMRQPGSDARALLTDALALLELPGAELLRGSTAPAEMPGAVLVEPDRRNVARFDAAVHDEITLRAELGLDR